MFEGEPASSDDGRGFDGAHMLATALASVASTEESDPPASATLAAQRRLLAWRERTGAPESELKRAGRRLAAVIGRLEPARVRAALTETEPRRIARAFVDECGRWDRDFVWDVPLRDTARAIIAAAARAVSDEIADARPGEDDPEADISAGDISNDPEGGDGGVG
jgi:hypothetical protein